LEFIIWVEECHQYITYVILINGLASPFFFHPRVFDKATLVSLLLFSIIAKYLSWHINHEYVVGGPKGIKIFDGLYIKNIIFMDNTSYLEMELSKKPNVQIEP
jgi:hypothetical protein